MSFSRSKPVPDPSPLRGAWRASLGGLTAVLVFGVFINLLKFAMPLYTLQILDRIPSSRSIETLVMLTLIALLAVLAGVALEAIRSRLLGAWGGWIERRFGPPLVAAGIGTGTAHNGVSPSADNALKDLSTLRSFVERAAAPLLDLMWAPLFVAAVYLVHPLLGAVMLAAIALRLLLALAREALLREPRRAAGDARDDARDIVAGAQRNADTVGALGMAANLTRRWHSSVSTRLEERDRAAARSDLMTAFEQGLYRLLYVGGMGAGIWLVILGELTIGGVIAGNIIMRFGFRLVDRGARRWRMLGRARVAYRRVTANLAATVTSAAASGTSMSTADLDAPLRVERASYRYPGAREAVLKRLDLSLEKGEVLSVMGPSGSGKSTFAQLLAGRLVPGHGQVLLGNTAVARLPDAIKARFAGYLPQHPALFNGSVRDNIARMDQAHTGAGIDTVIDAVIDAAKLADIHDAIVRLPQGYDTVLDSEAPGLSGGERKRIALARAFYGRPRLVVLDEPEAALDRASRRVLQRAVQTLRAAGSTVVVTTQSGRLARSADRSLILGGDRPRLVDAAEAAVPVSARVSAKVSASVEDLDRRRQRRQSGQPSPRRGTKPAPATTEPPR